MPSLIEDLTATRLADFLQATRPEALCAIPIHIAHRDELRTRPCIVIDTPESRPVIAMPNTAKVRVNVHLFSQIDDTPADTHATWAGVLSSMLADLSALRVWLDSDGFVLHDLIARDSMTAPDETRGRETTLSYEAVVFAM